ncbi:MAG: hypothetical protein ACPLZC_06580 [Candidatus Bathyarchaeales archaeon]
MKTADTYLAYPLIDSPISWQRTFPGNIGYGIRSEATINIEKKANRMGKPFTFNHSVQSVLYAPRIV